MAVDVKAEGGSKPSKAKQLLAAFSCSLSAMCVGMSLSWTSPVLPLLTANAEEPHLTIEQSTWVGSLLNVGAFIGCLPAGSMADYFGRKRLLLLLLIPIVVGWTLILLSGVAWGLCLGRLLLGFSLGVVSVGVPTYVNEISTPDIRGTLGSLFQLQLTIGVLFMYFSGLIGTVFGMTLVCTLMPLLFLGCFLWMPESPVYLLSKDKLEEAGKALQWLRGANYNIQQELSDLQKEMTGQENPDGGILDLFKSPLPRKAILISLGLMFFQQVTGINAIVFYAMDIFDKSGGSVPADVGCILVSFVTVLATGAASLLMDVAGRRLLLLISITVQGACLLSLGAFTIYKPEHLDWLPLASLALFCISFSLGFGPIPWILMAELFQPQYKASASALAATSSWLLAFIVTKYYQDLATMWGVGYTFWFFSIFCGFGTVFVLLTLPETKGKTTEAIMVELGARSAQPASSDNTTKDDAAV